MGLREDDEIKARRILSNRIEELEALVNGAQKALFETDLKIHAVMLKLLTANDVNRDTRGWKGMRENILENMNDLQRQVNAFFKNEGIAPNAGDNIGQ